MSVSKSVTVISKFDIPPSLNKKPSLNLTDESEDVLIIGAEFSLEEIIGGYNIVSIS
jgi:hypothetical protein